jgi:hypothetical protein
MTIATLPPSVHIRAIRQVLDRMRRTTTYGMPTRDELAHATESLNQLEAHINQSKGKPA